MRRRQSRLRPPSGRPLRIGYGAGYSNDRVEPAVELVERGDLDCLVFECLAERTIALAQQAKARDPHSGFDPRLREGMEAVLAACHGRGVTLVTNMGAANPQVSRHTAGNGRFHRPAALDRAGARTARSSITIRSTAS